MPHTYHIEKPGLQIDIEALSRVQESVLMALGYGMAGEGGIIKPGMSMYDLTRYAAQAQRRDTSQYYAVIHKATKQLKARGLVHIIRYEKGQKGAMKHIYDLTELGRWRLLAQVQRLDLRRFANCQRQMSRYFDRWDFLESMHVTGLVKRIVRNAANRLFLEMRVWGIESLKGVSMVLGVPGVGYSMHFDPEETRMPFWPARTQTELRDFKILHFLDDELGDRYVQAAEDELKYRKESVRQMQHLLEQSLFLRDEFSAISEKARKEGLPQKQVLDLLWKRGREILSVESFQSEPNKG